MPESILTHSLTAWRSVGLRFGLMALLWLGLTGDDWNSWLVGLPVVVVTTWLSLKLGTASYWRWSLKSLVPFCWYFTKQSILGGWDVALTTFNPERRLNPGMISYPLRLPVGPSQLFFCGTVSLLPGSLVVSIEDSIALIHVLDISTGQETSLGELENRIARLFALQIYSDKV